MRTKAPPDQGQWILPPTAAEAITEITRELPQLQAELTRRRMLAIRTAAAFVDCDVEVEQLRLFGTGRELVLFDAGLYQMSPDRKTLVAKEAKGSD